MAAAPRLFLVTPKIADPAAFAPLLETAVAAADVACVLIRAAARDDHSIKAVARVLAPAVQRHGAAALVEAEARLAARLDLDGVHLDGAGDAPLKEALAALKPDRIVGIGGLESRDDAMAAGEAGVDYVMFGAADLADEAGSHEAIRERVAWWAEIFNVPCVGYAARPDLALDMARAGAEFIGLGDALWAKPDALARTLAELSDALSAEEVR